ncbi:MAG: hypothetical protein N2712_04325 [Brevinematales bacterium]|nr:hypothetical protein [Brevinematales bacterium]
MDKESIVNYIVKLLLNNEKVDEKTKDRINIWKPLIEYKIDNVAKVIKNLNGETRNQVMNVIISKVCKIIVDIDNAVRKNYAYGEDQIIRAIVEILTKDKI